MTDRKYKTIVIVVALNMLMTHPVFSAVTRRNLALHKKLGFTQKPAYHLTQHPRDPYLLTDGKIDKSLWYERYREKTVGWYLCPLVKIKIDLGKVCNVGEVKIHTVGGGRAGVEYPEYAVAATSIDDVKYQLAALETSDDWIFGKNLAKPKKIHLSVMQRARFIKLFVRPTKYLFFSDEIEVLEAENKLKQEISTQYVSEDQIIDFAERVRQLQRNTDVLKKNLNYSSEVTRFSRMESEIGELSRNADFAELTEIESDFSVFRGELLHSEFKTDWMVYRAEPMDILRYRNMPPKTFADPAISFYQWQNEHGTAALNLVNCSNAPVDFRTSVSPLQYDGNRIDSRDVFEVRRAVYIRVLNTGLVADPLVLQGSKAFSIGPGETAQLWLEADSKGLKAGLYTAALAIIAEGRHLTKTTQSIPIKLEVASETFPEKVTFDSCVWDYVTTSDRFTGRNTRQTKEAVVDLNKHHVNVVTLRHDSVCNDKGLSLTKLTGELSLRDTGDCKVLLLLGGSGSNHPLRKMGKLRTVQWESAFRFFINRFRDYMLDKGYDYDAFAIYPYDEYIGDDFVYVARLLRQLDPRIRIYANKWIEPKEFQNLKGLIDIWCPSIYDVLRNKNRYDRYCETKIINQIWCYSADLACERLWALPGFGFTKDGRSDIKLSWRVLPISAASLNMSGAGFWVYQDSNRTGWNKDQFGNYGVIYDGTANPHLDCIPELIVPSKRWQQWREGVEDAVCLSGHKELLDEYIKKTASQITSDYLTSLRKRADKQ